MSDQHDDSGPDKVFSDLEKVVDETAADSDADEDDTQ